tara:strand:- start:281 stop:619 length:339 start_codon:yes stop_codon:yes gene_type:complete
MAHDAQCAHQGLKRSAPVSVCDRITTMNTRSVPKKLERRQLFAGCVAKVLVPTMTGLPTMCCLPICIRHCYLLIEVATVGVVINRQTLASETLPHNQATTFKKSKACQNKHA